MTLVRGLALAAASIVSRKKYGIAPAAGGVLVALASASSDVAVNTVSAIKGVGQIGLGNLLGSNVVSIPLVATAAYLASRKKKLGGGGEGQQGQGEDHSRHVKQGTMRIERGSVTVVALPYLGMVALFAVLTAVPAWRGLQLIDGLILLVVYLVFLAQAVARGSGGGGQQVQWSRRKTLLALGGLAALAVGSIVIVRATQRIAGAIGIPPLVAGLFLTATMTALPAAFTTWAVTRSGQVTSGVSSPFGDNAVALTLGAVPLAVAGLQVQNYPVYLTVLVFVALMPAVYAGLVVTAVSSSGVSGPGGGVGEVEAAGGVEGLFGAAGE